MTEQPRICDYEGSNYRTDFWEGRGRNYEDTVERLVLRQLLPQQGRRLLEIGAGFGRLSQEYAAFDQVVLLDYSFSQLQFAREQLGDEGYLYVAADAYRLPFQPGVFDAATMIRVIHHFENVPAVVKGIRQVLAKDAAFILEFANKRNAKALLRYAMGRQQWNPNAPEAVEFVELNYNFHPQTIQDELASAGFRTTQRVPISFLRMGLLKKYVPQGLLVGADQLLQRTGWMISPSIFTSNSAVGESQNQVSLTGDAIFACPQSGSALSREGDTLVSAEGLRWEIRDGIYDFKAPMS